MSVCASVSTKQHNACSTLGRERQKADFRLLLLLTFEQKNEVQVGPLDLFRVNVRDTRLINIFAVPLESNLITNGHSLCVCRFVSLVSFFVNVSGDSL